MKKKISLILGTFDGVHIAHQKIIERAKENGRYPVAVTLSLVPKSFFSGDKVKPIMTNVDRNDMLRFFGVKEIETLDFAQIKDDLPEDFLKKLYDKYHPQAIYTGFNYRFGKNQQGDVSLLADFCRENNIEYIVENEVKVDGLTVSSTNIRTFLKNGEPEKAAKMLGFNFFINNYVVHGNALGREMGFATINQNYDQGLTELAHGVYASVVTVDGIRYDAITNFGIRPTFNSHEEIVETHILGYSGDLYGRKIKTEFLRFMRPEIRFNNIEELKNAIKQDKQLRQQIL